MSIELTEPRCLEFELLDLVTGERTLHASCHGDAIADPLGPLALDPTAALAANCSGQVYVCEVSGDAWDAQSCTTWPDGAPFVHPSTIPDADEVPEDAPPPGGGVDDGCRMGAEPTPSAAWLVALVLLGVRWNRRRAASEARPGLMRYRARR